MSGYTLQGIKCVSNTNIGIQSTFDTDIPNFIQNMNSFKNELASGLGAPFSQNRNWITINSIRTGSVVAATTLDVPPGQSADTVKNSVDNILSSGGSIAGMPVVSSSSTINGGGSDNGGT